MGANYDIIFNPAHSIILISNNHILFYPLQLQRKKVDLIAAYEEEVVGITSKLRYILKSFSCIPD